LKKVMWKNKCIREV